VIRSLMTAGLCTSLFAGAAMAQVVNTGTPTPDCTARVNHDRNADLPGYVDDKGICHPFMPLAQLVPADYRGPDFYLTEFTDAKIRARWETCKHDPACAAAARKGASGFARVESRDTGAADARGRIDPEGNVDLKAIRRPAYFGAPPYLEPIAKAEGRTFTVEFTAPRDSYERRHLKKDGEIRLRGWYLVGEGIEADAAAGGDASGGAGADAGKRSRRRALVIMNNGGGGELTAIDDPGSDPVRRNPETGRYVLAPFPDSRSEEPGMRHWRGFIAALNAAGFDVLVTDRRGNGISGGLNGFNTAEQANDIFRELDQLRTGQGLRVLTSAGEVLQGAPAATAVLSGADLRSLPIVLGGYSRGSYAVAWAMHKNFVENCNHDVPDGGCSPVIGNANIKGAILYGPNSGGLGTRVAGHDMIEAALRTEFSTTYYVDSGVAAGVDRWPALQIIKGTWDYVEGLEGSLETYRRAKGLKDIFVFHGPHQLETQSPENMRLVGERMASFAKAAVLGKRQVEGAVPPADLKRLVLSAPDHWERTTPPEQSARR
jgi:pimeloyl-ACP methyl ester carboxylesterase